MKDFIYRCPEEDGKLSVLLQNTLVRTLLSSYQKLIADGKHFAEVRNRNLLVTEHSAPRLHRLYQAARRRLQVTQTSALYLEFSHEYSARITGTDGDAVILLSGMCVQDMSDEELLAMIGGQLAHVQCGHVLWLGLEEMLEPLMSRIPFAGPAAMEMVRGLLLDWRSCANTTEDRSAALVCGSSDYVIQAMLRRMGATAGYRPGSVFEPVTEQVSAQSPGVVASTIMQRVVRSLDIPFGVRRMADLVRWTGSDWCKCALPLLYYNSQPPQGFDTQRNPQEAARFSLHAKARQGDAQAMAELGLRYLRGKDGYPQDADFGLSMLMKSAAAGHPGAETLLGRLYRSGVPHLLPSDPSRADWMTRLAAGQGHPQAIKEHIRVPTLDVTDLQSRLRIEHIPGPEERQWAQQNLLVPRQDALLSLEVLSWSAMYPEGLAICSTGLYLRRNEAEPDWIDWGTFSDAKLTLSPSPVSDLLFLNGRQLWQGHASQQGSVLWQLIALGRLLCGTQKP